MFLRMLKNALFRQKKKGVMIALTMTLGVSLATAMLNVVMDVQDKINQELKTYGANINVLPKGAALLGDLYGIEQGDGVVDKFISEKELGKIKTIFWANNIVDFAPYLELNVQVEGQTAPVVLVGTWFDRELDLPTGEAFQTGMKRMKAWWEVSGRWLKDSDTEGAMVGGILAEKLKISRGDKIRVSLADGKQEKWLTVYSTFYSGSSEDEQIFVPLSLVQSLAGQNERVQRIEVSALTTPDNELARRAAEDPNSLSRKEWDTWYCTAYISSIAYQIEEVLTHVKAKPVLQVSESEGTILNKIKLLMLLLTVLSLVCSALGISNLVSMNVMERSLEIGLMKATGGANGTVSILILSEMLVISLIGGVFGYGAGIGLSQMIGHTVFGVSIAVNTVVISLIVLIVIAIAVIGSLPALRILLSLEPARVLHGR